MVKEIILELVCIWESIEDILIWIPVVILGIIYYPIWRYAEYKVNKDYDRILREQK